MIKLAILDFDDTLIDNIKMDFESFQRPCKELGMSSLRFDKIVSFRKNGMNAKEIIKEIIKEKNTSISDKFNKIRENFLEDPKNFEFFEIKDNFRKFFQYIDERKIKLVLATSRSNKNEIISFLKKNNVLRFFSEIVTKEDIIISTNNRNYLDRLFIKNIIIKKILRKNFIDSSNVVYIGNAIEDLITANNMKINFIGIQNYYLKENNFSDSVNVDDIDMLINEFEKLNRC